MERDNIHYYNGWAHNISTHTLTWSVTVDRGEKHEQNDNFNSHAHVERDVRVFTIIIDLLNFNSHAHVERDKSNIDNKQM